MRRELLLPLAVLALGLAAAGGFFAASAVRSDGGEHKSTRVQVVPREPEIVAPRLGRAFVGLLLSDEPNGGGVRIARVVPGSAADDAGLKRDDVITAVDGQSVRSVDDVRGALEDKSPGDRVTFSVSRDGEEEEVAVTLGRLGELLPQQPLQPTPPGEGNREHMGTAYLGVRLAYVTPEVQEELDLPGVGGVAVVEVERSGPAYKAGLLRGDVILMIGAEWVQTVEEAQAAILDHEPGESVPLLIRRGVKELHLDVELGTQPGMDMPTEVPPEWSQF
jgi:S1-C subfamily serine protease